MNVADLFASFGFDTDFESIAKVHSALAQVEQHTRETAEAAKTLSALQFVSGDSAKALDLIGIDADKAAKAVEGTTKRTFDWHRAILTVNQALGIATRVIGGIQRGIGFVRGLVSATEAQAAQSVELAQRFGITAEAVQELGFAAGQSGADLETLTTGLGGLSDKLDAAKKGGKDAAASLRAVGVDIADVRSGRQTLDGTLGQIAEKFAAMPDGATKSALAVDLFGKSGRKLIPLLNEGSSGIDALRQQARDLGIVIDGDTAAALENFGDQTEALHAQFDGLRNQAIAAILPMLTDLVASVQAWVTANRELLVGALTGALKILLLALRAVGAAFAYLVEVFDFFAQHTTLLTGLLSVLGAAFIVMGGQALIAWLMALGPIPLIALAIGAIILLLPALVGAMKKAGRAIGDVFEWIGDKLKAMGRGIMDGFRAVGRFLAGVARDIKDGFVAALDAVIDVMNDAIRLYNRVPGLPDIDTIGHIGGDQTAAATPRRTVSAGRSVAAAGTTIHDNRQVALTVNAGNANPQETAALIKSELDSQWRTAYDGLKS